MFTANEYRTAAKVFREEFEKDIKLIPAVSDILETRAENSERFEEYVKQLGLLVGVNEHMALYAGVKIIDKLRADGWTAPEGLF